MKTYVVLLRGINVGGNNIIRMADLRDCLEKAGYADVQTYIQSGNIVLKAEVDEKTFETEMEQLLSKEFEYESTVVILTADELREVVNKAPNGFGQKPDEYRCDFIFLKKPLTASEALSEIELRDGVDEAWEGPGVLYFVRLDKERTKSKLSKIVQTKIYKQVTIRNWNTTMKLLRMIND